MADNDWKSRLGVVFSTNPDFQYETSTEEVVQTLPPEKQRLVVRIDRRARAGKQVTAIEGFVGGSEDLSVLARAIKVKIGVGGSAKDGVIFIQGDFRDRVVEYLIKAGYNARRGN